MKVCGQLFIDRNSVLRLRATVSECNASDDEDQSHPALLLDLGDVSSLGIILAHTLLGLPGVPLGLALHVEHSWALSVDITDRALLEQAVELKFIFVAHGADLIGNVCGGHAGCGIVERHLTLRLDKKINYR